MNNTYKLSALLAISFVLMSAFSYAVISFSMWETNAYKWGISVRVLYAFIVVVLLYIAVVIGIVESKRK